MSTTQSIEVKKDGLSQLQDGSWVLKLKVHPNDMPTSLMTLPMGTRFMAALVEIGDDEKPVERPKERQPFHTLDATLQSVLKCQDEKFRTFLAVEKRAHIDPEAEMKLEDQAATAVRRLCDVNSRSMLNTNKDAARKWKSLMADYDVWDRT